MNLGAFTCWRQRDVPKTRDARAKLLFCESKLSAFLSFSVPSPLPSSLLIIKLPIKILLTHAGERIFVLFAGIFCKVKSHGNLTDFTLDNNETIKSVIPGEIIFLWSHRDQNNGRSTANVLPEWRLERPKTRRFLQPVTHAHSHSLITKSGTVV